MCIVCTIYVYIVCIVSILMFQENELVVKKALKKFAESYKLEYAIPDWKHRGHTVFPTGIHYM